MGAGKLRLAVILLHGALTADTYLAYGPRRTWLSVLADDAYLRAGDGAADRVKVRKAAVEMIGREEDGHHAAHLRHSVGLIKLAVEPLHRALQQSGRHRAGRITDGMQRTEIIRLFIQLVQYPFQYRRHDAYGVNVLTLEALHVLLRGKGAHQDKRAAGTEAEPRAYRGGVEEL